MLRVSPGLTRFSKDLIEFKLGHDRFFPSDYLPGFFLPLFHRGLPQRPTQSFFPSSVVSLGLWEFKPPLRWYTALTCPFKPDKSRLFQVSSCVTSLPRQISTTRPSRRPGFAVFYPELFSSSFSLSPDASAFTPDAYAGGDYTQLFFFHSSSFRLEVLRFLPFSGMNHPSGWPTCDLHRI